MTIENWLNNNVTPVPDATTGVRANNLAVNYLNTIGAPNRDAGAILRTVDRMREILPNHVFHCGSTMLRMASQTPDGLVTFDHFLQRCCEGECSTADFIAAIKQEQGLDCPDSRILYELDRRELRDGDVVYLAIRS